MRKLLLVLGLLMIMIFAGCVKKVVEEDKCSSILDGQEFGKCYGEQAALNFNQNICANIPTLERREICNRAVLETRYTGLDCETYQTEQERDECNLLRGTHQKEEQYCDRIIDLTLRDSCYLGLVMKNTKINICDKIENEEIKAECLNQFS